jgi:preprotein translocase subunit SecG
MITVLLVVHLLIAIALVITVLLQPSEGGGLGLGGGGTSGAGIGGFLSGRGTANALTRTTAVLAACFMATSVALTILAGGGEQDSILDELPEQTGPSEPGAGQGTTPTPEGGEGTGSGNSGEGPAVPLE